MGYGVPILAASASGCVSVSEDAGVYRQRGSTRPTAPTKSGMEGQPGGDSKVAPDVRNGRGSDEQQSFCTEDPGTSEPEVEDANASGHQRGQIAILHPFRS